MFLSEGIDSEGHAANYVETEQIVQYNNAKASFVQVSPSNNTIGEITYHILIGDRGTVSPDYTVLLYSINP